MRSDRPDDADYAAYGIETLTKCVTPSKRQLDWKNDLHLPECLIKRELMFDFTGTSKLRKKRSPYVWILL